MVCVRYFIGRVVFRCRVRGLLSGGLRVVNWLLIRVVGMKWLGCWVMCLVVIVGVSFR